MARSITAPAVTDTDSPETKWNVKCEAEAEADVASQPTVLTFGITIVRTFSLNAAGISTSCCPLL